MEFFFPRASRDARAPGGGEGQILFVIRKRTDVGACQAKAGGWGLHATILEATVTAVGRLAPPSRTTFGGRHWRRRTFRIEKDLWMHLFVSSIRILEARARPGLRSLCGGRSRRVAPLAAGGSNRQLLSRHTAMVGSQMLPVRGYVVFTRCQAPPSVPGGVLIPPAAWR